MSCLLRRRKTALERRVLAVREGKIRNRAPRGYPTTELDGIHVQERLRHYEECQVRDRSTGVTYPRTSMPYAYLPLSQGQIRVLGILPGEENSGICCTVEHIDLGTDQAPKYEALSYCWEGPNEEKTIWIEGCRFTVSKSLFEVMNCLHYPQITRTFWIDAISINQDRNDTEKRP